MCGSLAASVVDSVFALGNHHKYCQIHLPGPTKMGSKLRLPAALIRKQHVDQSGDGTLDCCIIIDDVHEDIGHSNQLFVSRLTRQLVQVALVNLSPHFECLQNLLF